MQIILTRHGETDLNRQHIISGQDNAKLTELGMRQAAALAQALLRYAPIKLYCSDLKRAADTAQIIQKKVGGEILYIPELRERSYGEIQGKTDQAYEDALKSSGLTADEFRPPGGESRLDLKKRVKPALDSILAETKNTTQEVTPVIVAHHSVNRRLLSICLGDAAGEFSQGNCCINLLKYDSVSGFEAVLINSTEHLVGLTI